MDMKINSAIFKAYDIRGIYPKDLNEKIAYLLGLAFVKFLHKKKLNIVVGRDYRLSSENLYKYLVKGILQSGANVIDIGLATTPMLYFAVANFKFDGGIQITASHNPSEYNGFKIVREKAMPIGETSGLKKIKNYIEKSDLLSKNNGERTGKIMKKEVLSDYLDFNLKEFKPSNFKPFKICLDFGNAVPAILLSELEKRLKFLKIYPLFPKLDGNFPNHPPNPVLKENLIALKNAVKNKKADLGIGFDGDGDRIIFIDERDEIIPADLITALLSQILLSEKSGEKILYDIRSSKIVKEVIIKNGGIPILSRVGHSFIKSKMKKENIVFAGEFSGHYYSREHYFCEAPLFVLLKILERMSLTKKCLSELISPFQKYFHSGEINFPVENKEKVLKSLEKKYQSGKISRLDGLRIDFKDWWFNIRPSQTEPMLRLVLEANKKDLLEEKRKKILKIIS